MPLTDQTLYCRDSTRASTFTIGEQEFYASRGLSNAPSPARSAAPHTSNLVVGRGIPLVEGAAGFANANHVNCIAAPARVVGMRRKCLFSPAMTDLYIAVHVTNCNVLVTQTTEDRVGNVYDRDFGKAR